MNAIAQSWAKVSCGNPTCTLEQLVIAYQSSKHPAVIKGYNTAQEVFNEFVKMWDKDADGVVTMNEFCEYFKVRFCALGMTNLTVLCRILVRQRMMMITFARL